MRYGPRLERLECPDELEVLGEYADDAIGAAEEEVFGSGGDTADIVLSRGLASLEGGLGIG